MITYETLHDFAMCARTMTGITRPGAARIRVGPSFDTCGSARRKVAHVHCVKGCAHYGRICINENALDMADLDWFYTMLHEVLHFRYGARHTQKFWKEQELTISCNDWNAIVNRGKALIQSR